MRSRWNLMTYFSSLNEFAMESAPFYPILLFLLDFEKISLNKWVLLRERKDDEMKRVRRKSVCCFEWPINIIEKIHLKFGCSSFRV
jgi:hypothetical protein